MKSIIGREAVPKAEYIIKRNPSGDIYRRKLRSENESSCIGCLHIFNETYQASLSAGVFNLCPKDTKLLNFSKNARRQDITNDHTVGGYFPVVFDFEIGDVEVSVDKLIIETKDTEVFKG